MSSEAASTAIDAAGGTFAVAEYFELTPSSVSQWRKRGVPSHYVLDLEELCANHVSRYELRPDVFGSKRGRK